MILDLFRTLVLYGLKTVSRTFYRFEVEWMGGIPPEPWRDLRIATVLNHTSLYEWLLAGAVPNPFLRKIAQWGYVPVADVTISRPFFGRFLRILAPKFLSITREPDHTWRAVIDSIEPESLVIIFPEGRMKRANGLDKYGRPMTVRGGIADLLEAVPEGKMVIVYSGGLHHIQVPGQTFPKLFRTIRVALEFVDIEEYREARRAEHAGTGFKAAVKADLEERRAEHCGRLEALNGIVYPEASGVSGVASESEPVERIAS